MKTSWIRCAIGLVVVVVVLASLPVGCGEGGKDSGEQTETAATIGVSGGVVEVADESRPLHGVKVSVPEGALDEETDITIGAPEGEPPIPEGFVDAGAAARLGPSGTVFQVPVGVTLPYDDSVKEDTSVRVWKCSTDNGSWAMMPTDNVDTEARSVTVHTYSFSYFRVLASSGVEPPPKSPDIDFQPARDGLASPNKNGTCYGETAFVQWYWMNKRAAGGPGLMGWHAEQHSDVAKMVQCTTWLNVGLPDSYLSSDNMGIAHDLMWSLWGSRRPVLMSFSYLMAGRIKTKSHAVLVYGYETRGTDVRFSVYDPNCQYKRCFLIYDMMDHLEFSGCPDYQVYGFYIDGWCPATKELDFVYEYFENPPEITDASPTGRIDALRPTISAVIHYPYYDKQWTVMSLDGRQVTAESKAIDDDNPHDARISFTPGNDLDEGVHTVCISGARGLYSRKPDGGWCADPIPDYSWTFTIGPESSLIGTWELQSVDGETPWYWQTMTFTEDRWTCVEGDLGRPPLCTELSTYSTSGGILKNTGVLSVSGSGCEDSVGESFTIGPFTVTDTTLTITHTLVQPAMVFVFVRR